MPQLSYSQNFDVGVAGMLYDIATNDVVTRANPVDEIPFGLAVCRGTNPDKHVKLPTTAAEAAACIGIAIKTNVLAQDLQTSPRYPIKSAVNVLKKGRVWVQVLEAVVAGDDVYVRYANGIGDVTDLQKGAFGKTPDGTAQVSTLTPTAADSTVFSVEVNGRLYQINSGSSATATTIVTALKAAMASDLSVNATGTATLILTAKVLGVGFTVGSSPNIAIVATTANAASAALMPNAKFESSAAANALAIVSINKP